MRLEKVDCHPVTLFIPLHNLGIVQIRPVKISILLSISGSSSYLALMKPWI